jgi:hypothetical protein
VNGVALVPAPYGPRMAVRAALTVIREVLLDNTLGRLGGGITRAFPRRYDLVGPLVWVKGGVSVARRVQRRDRTGRGVRRWVSGVPEKEAAGRIVKANKGAFSRDGDLRAGWDRYDTTIVPCIDGWMVQW